MSSLLNSRAKAEARLKLLGAKAPEIVRALENQQLAFVDHSLYVVKKVQAAGRIQDLVDPNDTSTVIEEKPVSTNINNGKLETDQPMLVAGIILKQGTYGNDNTKSALENLIVPTDTVDDNVKKGNITIVVTNERRVISKASIAAMFDNAGDTSKPKGLHVLDNPFWILPGNQISVEIAAPREISANQVFELQLVGTGLARAGGL